MAGQPAVVTALYFIALYALPALVHRLPRIGTSPATVQLAYSDGQGVLRRVLETCTLQGFSVAQIDLDNEFRDRRPGVVDVALVVFGRTPASVLAASPEEIAGVLSVAADDSDASES